MTVIVRSRTATHSFFAVAYLSALVSAGCGFAGFIGAVDGGPLPVADGASGPDASAAPDGGPAGNDGGSAGIDSGTVGAPDAGDPLAAARSQCVQIINSYRASLSPPSPPLAEALAEESCVDQQAKADYTANQPHYAFGRCGEYAQDECPGLGRGRASVCPWLHSRASTHH